MRFHTDHYFQMGAAHYSSGKPCQDYSRSGSNNLIACAIVSDGCSTGGHTDVGSRILTLSTFQAIHDHAKASLGALDTAVVSITSRQQQILGTARLMLGLERVDMLATCGYAYLTQHGGFVHIQGDGVVGLKYRDGRIKMYRYEWADNTPFYPSYGEDSIMKFVDAHGGNWGAKRLSCTTVIRKADGQCSEESVEGFTLQEGLEGVVTTISQEELEEAEFVAVFSDGITQIDHVDWKDAVTSMFAFKNTAGEFAKRRMMWEIKNLQKIGKGPIDDISYAVVRIEKNEEGEEASG